MADPTDNQNFTDPLTTGDLITLTEAAAYAGLSRESIHSYVKRNRLKAKKVGPIWLTTKAAVDEYLQSRHLENIPKKLRRRD